MVAGSATKTILLSVTLQPAPSLIVHNVLYCPTTNEVILAVSEPGALLGVNVKLLGPEITDHVPFMPGTESADILTFIKSSVQARISGPASAKIAKISTVSEIGSQTALLICQANLYRPGDVKVTVALGMNVLLKDGATTG